jgi:hypothetical protein
MTYIFNQFRGLGDILFLVPIARHYIAQGHKVIFPVNKSFIDIKDSFPDIEFCSILDFPFDYERRDVYEYGLLGEHYKVIPFRFADKIMNVTYQNNMVSKYKLVGLPLSMWRTLSWTRNKGKENDLYYNVLQLEKDQKYILINNTFNSTFKGICNDIQVLTSLRIVSLTHIEEYSLLDWGKVIENASEIYTVHTSLQYMLECMALKCVPYIYCRKPMEENHNNYNYLFRKKYNYR